MSDKHNFDGNPQLARFVSVINCPGCGEAHLLLSDEENLPFAVANLPLATIVHLITALSEAKDQSLAKGQCEGRA